MRIAVAIIALIVVPAFARLLAPRLSELLGQQVIVDNRAGGNARREQ